MHFEEEATSLVNPVTPSVEPDHRIVDIIPRTVVLLILHPVENIHTKIDASSSTELLQVSKIKLLTKLISKLHQPLNSKKEFQLNSSLS